MQKTLARLVLPAVLAVLSAAPAAAQVRIGVELPSIHIRIAPDAPPPPQVEVRMHRPSRDHRWIAGYWDRQDDRWAWAPGRWEQPSRRGSSWIAARYQREGGAYRYEPGHWSHEKMVEGDDYTRWHRDHGRGPERHGDRDRDHERDDHRRD
ncbi:MAG: YXWGXW repeat-containing protein [Geothrix sp.]|uniref:hypothetical protein n=1 Tax=Geothrix sp. TaxID=1962974 RepID=UPI0017B3BBA3|nr:hypothetical protein [Geothrix sp.]NWJ41016.1 YXWGXW repeat-containing protein [Geothrix sp.]WIL20987.1 MAG: hypothetical protein QOZ81_000227 [Geothrix sp.]